MIEKDGFSTAEYPTGAKFKFSYSQKKGDQNSKSEWKPESWYRGKLGTRTHTKKKTKKKERI